LDPQQVISRATGHFQPCFPASRPVIRPVFASKPGREGIPGKIPTVREGSAAETSRGKRGDCWREEGDGREEGVATPLESLRVLLLVVDLKVVQISQETRQVTDGVSKGVSVILPNNRKGMTFVGQALAV
jgi:hypothetical protein